MCKSKHVSTMMNRYDIIRVVLSTLSVKSFESTMILRERIYKTLHNKFSVRYLEICDDSHKHKAHAAFARQSHFRVLIVSEDFKDQSRIERHRQVYQALSLGNGFEKEVHALSIRAFTPEEWSECLPHIQKKESHKKSVLRSVVPQK